MLSANDIRDIKFSKAMGGYRQDEVEIFLDKVRADFEQYERDVRDLQIANDTLKKEIEGYKNSQSSIQNVLLSAQKLADQIVEDAKAKSEVIIKEAESNVDRISRHEQELSASFEEKANLRKLQIEAELKAACESAEFKKTAIEKATADAISRQQMLFDKLKLEIVAFKTDIKQKYKEHLELLQAIPDEVPVDPKAIAAAVSLAIDQVPAATSFIPDNRADNTVEAPSSIPTGFNIEVENSVADEEEDF